MHLFKINFIFGCTGSSLLCSDFSLVFGGLGLLSSCDVQASPCGGFSCCRAQAVGAWLWPTGLVAPLHAESSRIRDRTGVPWSASLIPIHCTTREVLTCILTLYNFCSASYPFITFSYFLIKECFVYFGYLSLVCYIRCKSYLPLFF